MGVHAAMRIAGGAVGLLVGGLLTSYASWRWVLFVNVPIGVRLRWPHRGCWPRPRAPKLVRSIDLTALIDTVGWHMIPCSSSAASQST